MVVNVVIQKRFVCLLFIPPELVGLRDAARSWLDLWRCTSEIRSPKSRDLFKVLLPDRSLCTSEDWEERRAEDK